LRPLNNSPGSHTFEIVAGTEAEPHVTESLKDEEDEFEADVMALVVVDEFPIEASHQS